ncbi:MAG: hypothetical protein KGJ64_15070, partial [Betaproteobacteria bacterium]|nr:hypothetical protein [Betaproteobacteria bacterium]
MIFAQAATIAMGALLALHALAPQAWRAAPAPAAVPPQLAARPGYREAAARAIPAVVAVTAERLR